VVSPGGCILDICNPVTNSTTDLQAAACSDGSKDFECGGDGVCCADYFPCTSRLTEEGC
jgi:hypothetical protein